METDFKAAAEEIKARVAAIDRMFEEATGWGSWMSEASAERRGLVRKAAVCGVKIEPKWELRTSDGRLSD